MFFESSFAMIKTKTAFVETARTQQKKKKKKKKKTLSLDLRSKLLTKRLETLVDPFSPDVERNK